MKREANFTYRFRSWLRANPLCTSAFEIKQTTTDSIPFNAVKEHQIDALLAVKHRNLLYKAPDDSRGVKPFDLFYMSHVGAYVVIKYPGSFHIIDIDIFIGEKHASKRKSLTSERAKEVAILSVKLSPKAKFGAYTREA